MKDNLNIKYGFYSSKGVKPINQDFNDIKIPTQDLLNTKGIVFSMADGISSSNVSQEASEVCVKSFIEDYYCTSEAWSVKNSASKVIKANNSWLYAKNRENQYHLDKDKGYVCTFTNLILKSTTAHIFHIGDIRVYQIKNNEIKQLTNDHRVYISNEQNYLSRAMGIDFLVNIDYLSLNLEKDDIYILATDGVYEFIDEQYLKNRILEFNDDYKDLSKEIIQKALENGSNDNLTIQILKIDSLPEKNANEVQNEINEKPIPDLLTQGQIFDGFEILKILSSNSRSHVYLALDIKNNKKVVLKAPSHDLQEDKIYLETLLMEEWIAKRIHNTHVIKAYKLNRNKNFLYTLFEYIEGQTLTQWINDNPNVSLSEVRNIVEQISKALQSFHTLEMVHQDLRPENILIDKNNIITIIDLGSTKVEGIVENDIYAKKTSLIGTALYSAPELFLGDTGTNRSDIFSLAVIIYQMISRKFPYGTNLAKASSKSAQNKLKYEPLNHNEIYIPYWFEESLKKALSINPQNRYEVLSEFIYDLKIPNKKFTKNYKPSLMEKEPVKFWKTLSFLLLLSNIYFMYY